MSDTQHDLMFEIKKASLINGKVYMRRTTNNNRDFKQREREPQRERETHDRREKVRRSADGPDVSRACFTLCENVSILFRFLRCFAITFIAGIFHYAR